MKTTVHPPRGNGATSAHAPAQIFIEEGVLRVRSIDVVDEVVLSYLNERPKEELEANFRRIVHVGGIALTCAGDQTGATMLAEALKTSTESTRTVLEEVAKTARESAELNTTALAKNSAQVVDKFRDELAKMLNPTDAASIAGKMQKALAEQCAAMEQKTREYFDPKNPSSPFAALGAELEKNDERRHEALRKQLTELLELEAAKKAAHAERSKSTRKGGDFETATEEFLAGECRARKDLVRRTSNEPGFTGGKVGDFVIEINPAEAQDLRVTIEDKSGAKGPTPRLRELERAMENRSAVAGISLSAEPAPQAIMPFGDTMMLVSVPQVDDGEWDFTALAVALECVRWKALMTRSMSVPLDVTRITADIDAAVAIVNRVTDVKRKVTTGKTQLDGIAECVDGMRSELLKVLQRIREAVNDGGTAAT